MGNDTNPTYFLACAATFISVCPIFVGLRLFTRRLQKYKIGIDDWLSVCALILLIGCGIVMIIGVHVEVFGFPTPTSDPGNHLYQLGQKLEWAFFLLLIPALGCIKLSFIFFFRRIFTVHKGQGTFSIASTFFIVLIIMWTTAFFLWFLLSCAPNIAGRWTNHKEAAASCPTDDMSDLALSISDVITDVMIFFLPVPTIFKLQMSIKRKLIVLSVFVLGSGALVASIIRLNYFVYAVNVSSGKVYAPHLDVNLLLTSSLYWSMIEAGLALICCSLPTLKALPRLPGVQSMVSSVRSALSLSSSGSGRATRQDATTSRRANSDSTNDLEGSSGIGLRALSKGSRGTSDDNAKTQVPQNKIQVERSVDLTYETV